MWLWDGSSFAAYQKLLFLSLYFMSVIFTFTAAVKKVFGHITTKRLVVMATESSIGSNASSSAQSCSRLMLLLLVLVFFLS